MLIVKPTATPTAQPIMQLLKTSVKASRKYTSFIVFFVIPTALSTAISFVCSRILAVIDDTSEKKESTMTITHKAEKIILITLFYFALDACVSL